MTLMNLTRQINNGNATGNKSERATQTDLQTVAITNLSQFNSDLRDTRFAEVAVRLILTLATIILASAIYCRLSRHICYSSHISFNVYTGNLVI